MILSKEFISGQNPAGYIITIRIMVLLLFGSGSLFAQDTVLKKFETKFVMGGGEQELLEEADYFFAFGDYDRAFERYTKLDKRYPGTIEYRYRAGVCCLFLGGEETAKAIRYLTEAAEMKPKLPEISYFLGRAYHLNNRFDEAIQFYRDAASKKTTSEENRKRAERYIEQCLNGKKLVENPAEVEINNLSNPVNSEEGEYAPVISADESVLIFTYKGKKSIGGLMNEWGEPDPEGQYNEDIFVSDRLGEQWLDPEGIGPRINKKDHEASIGLSADGKQLLIYLGTGGGDIYFSNLVKNNWSEPVSAGPKINTRHWEGSASLSADRKTLYFASDRPGGIGGRDIYVAELGENGQWGDPKNIGPAINTVYDEDAPFIHAVGTLLFFGSQGHNSMGGYDIFYSILEDSLWTKPVNIGYPVNTTDDDVHYTVAASCERAYFASSRAGGKGKQDIYVVRPGVIGSKPNFVLLKGLTQAGNKPVEAIIKVTNITKDEIYGIYTSYASTGNYLLTLPAGFDYQLDYEVKGKVTHREKVSTQNVSVYVEVEVVMDVSPKKGKTTDTVSYIQPLLNEQIKKMELIRPSVSLIVKEEEKPIAMPDCTLVVMETPRPEEKMTEPQVEEKAGTQESRWAGEKAVADSIARVKTIEEGKAREQERRKAGDKAVADSIARVKAVEEEKASEQERMKAREKVADSIARVQHDEKQESEEQKRMLAEARQKTITDSLAKIKAEKRAKFIADSLAKGQLVLKQKEVEEQQILLAEARKKTIADSLAKVKAEKRTKFVTDSINAVQIALMKKEEDGQKKIIAEARKKAIADSLAKAKAEKRAKFVADSIAKAQSLAVQKEAEKLKQALERERKRAIADSLARVKAEKEILAKQEKKETPPSGGRGVEKATVPLTPSLTRETATGLLFKVQVGAYPEKRISAFDGDRKKITDLGEIDSWTIDDLVRFTMGYFPSLRDATALQSVIRKRGVEDAFITAEVNGERKYLCEIYGQYSDRFSGVKIPFSPKGSSCEPVSTKVKTARTIPLANDYVQIVNSFGTKITDNLLFTVQVFATKAPSKYNPGQLNDLGAVAKKRYGDGITRFSVGRFNTLQDADDLRKKVMGKGVQDAFVTADYNGKRLLLTDLAQAGFDPEKVTRFL